MEKTTEQKYEGNFDEVFPIIDLNKLIGHKLLEHKPKNEQQKRLLGDIQRGIYLKLPAFRAPYMDPSTEEGKIVFKPGNRPVVGPSPVWWKETWKNFMPSKNSRIGTELHWAAFLGIQMMYLVEEKNYSVKKAWKAVCNNSRRLGHYWNSPGAKHGFEPTGSRKVGNFYDLANTSKILEKWDASGFLFASGKCHNCSYEHPLASLIESDYPKVGDCYSVGWLVLDV